MQTLRWTFKILMVCGCWRPSTWTSRPKKLLYRIYTIFVLLVVLTVIFTQLMDIILNVDNPDDFTDNIYVLLAMLVACCKMCSLLVNHENIGIMTDILEENPCAPMNPEEIVIRERCDKRSQSNAIQYITMVEISVLSIIVTSIFMDFRKGKLTFRAWLPYDYSSLILFSLTYSHQIIGFIAASLLQVACDCLICGLLVHTCSQIELLEHRLKNINNCRNEVLKAYAAHHDCIYKFATRVNKVFKGIIGVQFFVSTLVVCFNLYLLTNSKDLGAKLVHVISYMACMMTQIFIYCWYGNEVKVKSFEIISTTFGCNWSTLDNNGKKILLMIMRRATMPIEFTSVYVLSMNLDTFVNILKTSYSAFHVLQQARE